MTEVTPVQEYYQNKTIFITGASGFMGKVLLEKLLYSCHGVKEIIIVIRPKRGKSPETRLEEMFKLPMFQRIREERPQVLKKIICYQGDVTFESLGLTGAPLNHILNDTNIVFHLAATLKLEGNLKDAINFNLSGTRRTLDLAKQMKQLEAFIHLSTAFCNCDQEVMYEKVYDFAHKPEDLMRLAEWMDVRTLDAITPDLLTPHPNTYTYSKRLAELLVRDHYGKLPVMIARPSIVSPAAYEPVPGWVDNLNGPTGLMVGAGKGVIRSMLIDERHKSEVIPVDYAVNGLIVMPYEFHANVRPLDIPVYNITCAEHRKVPWGEVIALSKKIGYQYPMETGLWYPDGCVTTNRLQHQINVLLFHWLPAYFIDFILFLCGQKRFMLRVQRRVQVGLEVLQFFTMRAWSFKSPNYELLWQKLNEKDRKIFNMDMNIEDGIEEYMLSCIQGGRQYLMKESPESLPKARKQLKFMFCLDRFLTPAIEEPLPGWVDSLNGATGVLIGAGKGVIRSMLCNGEFISEIIPVDTAVNALIILPFYYKGLKEKPPQIPVFNITVPECKKRTWQWIIDVGRKVNFEYPFEVGLWYPDGCMTTNKLYHWFNVICFMWLPAVLIDALMTIFCQRRFMVRVQKRIAIGLEMLQFFTTRQWDFKDNNFKELEKLLNKEERKVFRINVADVDNMEYMKNSVLGGRQYVVKEPLSSLPRARIQLKFMYVLDRCCKAFIIGWLIYWLLRKLAIMEIFMED